MNNCYEVAILFPLNFKDIWVEIKEYYKTWSEVVKIVPSRCNNWKLGKITVNDPCEWETISATKMQRSAAVGVGFSAQRILIRKGRRADSLAWRDPLPCTPSRIPSSALAHRQGLYAARMPKAVIRSWGILFGKRPPILRLTRLSELPSRGVGLNPGCSIEAQHSNVRPRGRLRGSSCFSRTTRYLAFSCSWIRHHPWKATIPDPVNLEWERGSLIVHSLVPVNSNGIRWYLGTLALQYPATIDIIKPSRQTLIYISPCRDRKLKLSEEQCDERLHCDNATKRRCTD